MALMNVAINFGYEYFSFVIYFSKIFFSKFSSKNFFPTFFSNFFSKFFFQNFFSKFFFRNFFQNFFSKFVFWGLYFRCFSVYTDKSDSMYLCYEKYDIQQAVEIGL